MNKIFIAKELKPLIEKTKSLLNRQKLRLFTADTADEALEIHRREKLDLIIADIGMPDIGGDGLCTRIREDEDLGRVYFILICSGKKADLKRCEAAGANSFITRPFDLPEISDRVGRLLDIPRRQYVRVLVKVTVQGNFRSEPFYCTSRDISASGILIDTDKTLARGDVISCAFFLPGSDKLNVTGEVVRILRGAASPYSYGVMFKDLTSEGRTLIEEFISTEEGL